MLPREETIGLEWALLGRVSSSSQENNTSTAKQLNALKDEVDNTEGHIAKTYDLTESASTMDRDSLDEIVEHAKEDNIDVLGVWKLDRLTRADPWESLLYLNQLREEGVILYAHTHGYFEWDNLYDFEMLTRRVAFAREWHQRIIEGGHEGQVEQLEDGEWAFGDTPHGYRKDDDDKIELPKQGKITNEKLVSLYFEHENRSEVYRQVKDQIDISKSQVDNILQNPILMGDLTVKGQVVAHDEDLKVIDRERFHKLQELQDANSSAPSKTRDIPEPIDRAAYRFGSEFVIGLIDSIGIQCRRCESDLRPNGTTERQGGTVRKYRCTNQECGYEAPLLKQTEFEELHKTLPLRCPYCPITNQYEVEEVSAGPWDYKYTCENCGKEFGSDDSPNKIRRAMDEPSLAFSWINQTGPLGDEENESSSESEESESPQKTFASY